MHLPSNLEKVKKLYLIIGLSGLGGIKEHFISLNMTILHCKHHIKLLDFITNICMQYEVCNCFINSPEGQWASVVQCAAVHCGDGGTLPHTPDPCPPVEGSETSG